MTEIQNRLFEDLSLLKDILDNNKITYYLAYGTLLGAVRHNGFIPWDDDVDLYIKIEDLPRLRRVFENENGRLKLHDYTSHHDYPYSIPKVVDEKTILKEKAFEHLAYECGLYIDIFPLIEIPENAIWKKYLEGMRYFYYGLTKYYYIKQTRFVRFHKLVKKCINIGYVHRKMEKNLMSSHRKGKMVTDPLAFEERLNYSKEIFEVTTDIVFEGEFFKVPANYDYYLTKTYGNYMQLPPKSKRIGKHDYFYKILG